MKVDNDELIDPMEVRSSTRFKSLSSLFFIRKKIHYPSNFNFNFAINSLEFVLIYFPFFQVLVTAFILMLNTSINLDQPRPILDVDGTIGNQQQPYNYTGILRSGSPWCLSMKLNVAVIYKLHHSKFYYFWPLIFLCQREHSQDFSHPVLFRFTGNLLKDVPPINS